MRDSFQLAAVCLFGWIFSVGAADRVGALNLTATDRGNAVQVHANTTDQTDTSKPCPGDCNDDEKVNVNELVRLVAIALGNMSVSTCLPGDSNADGAVTVSEIVDAVSRNLNGCGFGPLRLDRATVCLKSAVESALPPQKISVVQTRGAWTSKADVSWLGVDPPQGEGPAMLQLEIATHGLTDGVYRGQITITDRTGASAQVSVALSLYGMGFAEGWEVQTVDTVGTGDASTALAIDATGRPAISFRRNIQNTAGLFFAHWDDCEWVSDQVEDGGFDSSMSFDSKGRPHLAYFAYSQANDRKGVLRYGFRDDTGWNLVTVDEPPDLASVTGVDPSLAIDSSDYPHIAYQEKTPTLRFPHYAVFDGFEWNLETVDSSGISTGFAVNGYRPSLALTSAGEPRMTYHRDGPGLIYAESDGADWVIDDNIEAGGNRSSLALNSQGSPVIANRSELRDRVLRFLFRDSDGIWHGETVDPQPFPPSPPASVSLALTRDGTPVIAYFDRSTSSLRYAVRAAADDWRVQIVDQDPGGNLGDKCSLAIDPNGVAHISYLDLSHGTLKYARGPALPGANTPTTTATPTPTTTEAPMATSTSALTTTPALVPTTTPKTTISRSGP